MGHCVFMLRPDSVYDDNPSQRYQFPKQYLSRTDGIVGDWIVYLEPSKVKRSRGYFAIARVAKIVEDPSAPGLYLAVMEPGSYLEFRRFVRFNESDGPIERGLLNAAGKLSGRAQAAVRPISTSDFLRIINKGLAETDPVLPRLDTPLPGFGVSEESKPFDFASERRRVDQLVSRPVRDRAFRRVVLRAYDERCAFTGLKFINGGGRAEVDAAHIRPVEHDGPDTVLNGIALSGTAHWMFDRGLISLSDDFEILISRQVNDIDSVRSFINKDGCAIRPRNEHEQPHPHFLEWHRDHCFKG